VDPDANLEEQRTLAARIIEGSQGGLGGVDVDDGIRLAELVDALDRWMKGGGFPPAAWRGKV
jgi:hypothetical protein